MSIWLPRLAIDRWRHSESCAEGEGVDAQPLALIAETAHGPRIAAGNAAALALGLRREMLLADARSLCPHLIVHPSDPEGDLAFLERLALWAQRWGPWSAIDPPDGLLVDTTGVAHLCGGEAAMLEDAQVRLGLQGLAARLSIAPTAGASWALARFGQGREAMQPGGTVLDSLPVAALRLDADVLLLLRRLGLKRIGDLHRIGRDALQRRFRTRRDPAANPLVRLDQLLGRVPEPLLPVIAVEVPLVQRRLLEPIRHRELLDVVVQDITTDMTQLLESRAEGARRLELGLWRVDGETVIRNLELAAATRDPAHIARLFSAKLDDVEAGFGIELVRMRASWCETLALSQSDFEADAEQHGTTLAACIDRLSVRLGEGAIRCPLPHASHLPERAQKWRPPMEVQSSQESFDFHQRPLKLLDRAEQILVVYATPNGFPHRFHWRGGVHDIVRVEGPERIAPEWWRSPAKTRLRDYYRIEDGEGRRYWIYRHGVIGDGRGGPPQWFLQGLCA